jgi:BrnA antitoxin of type II toxin-antitoxin system
LTYLHQIHIDVLDFFKARAAKPGAEPYQTQINRALREYMEREHGRATSARLDDEGFISHLAERVAEYVVRKRAPRRRPARRRP